MHLFWVDMHPDEISYTDGQCHSVVCTIENALQMALNFRLAEHGSVSETLPCIVWYLAFLASRWPCCALCQQTNVLSELICLNILLRMSLTCH